VQNWNLSKSQAQYFVVSERNNKVQETCPTLTLATILHLIGGQEKTQCHSQHISMKERSSVAKAPLAWHSFPRNLLPCASGSTAQIARHYGLDPQKIQEPRAATIDYVIAATAA
jgi:hypothetical protein